MATVVIYNNDGTSQSLYLEVVDNTIALPLITNSTKRIQVINFEPTPLTIKSPNIMQFLE